MDKIKIGKCLQILLFQFNVQVCGILISTTEIRNVAEIFICTHICAHFLYNKIFHQVLSKKKNPQLYS